MNMNMDMNMYINMDTGSGFTLQLLSCLLHVSDFAQSVIWVQRYIDSIDILPECANQTTVCVKSTEARQRDPVTSVTAYVTLPSDVNDAHNLE